MKSRTYQPFRRYVRVRSKASPIAVLIVVYHDHRWADGMSTDILWEDSRRDAGDTLYSTARVARLGAAATGRSIHAAIAELRWLGVWDATQPLTVTTWTGQLT